MRIKIKFAFLVILLSFQFVFAQRGKDGPLIVTNNRIVNEYAVLTADANVGGNILTVDNNSLNANARFSAALSQGDLIMIIQMQGANIFANSFVDGNGVTFGLPKDSSWGGILNYNNCGNYEIAEVSGVGGANIITLSCVLQNNYTAAGKVQVVRMPRFTSLTVNNAASITCDAWNGAKGGIVAIEVDAATIINGTVTATGKGFRGGVIDSQASFGSNDVASTSSTFGGEKGEGIAGFQNDYNIAGGRFCKGAPANGGGGGNMHNAGGGGGANGGNPLNWIAVGNPSLATANWANAWNLEWPGLASATSSGGGKGGYTASANNQNALNIGPNVGSWGGDSRNKQGGYGGRPLSYTANKIFFGGGGGAGDGNDGYTGAGGAAGGVVFLKCYGAISGAGTIVSNGNNGVNAFGTAPFNGIAGKDGAGGGGAGGTIFIETTSNIGGPTLTANGGEGGDQILTRGNAFITIVEAQGPGGGGSGGYINTTVAATATVNGGIHGVTDSPSLSEFTPNGATSGGVGTIINNLPSFDIIVTDVAVCSGNTAVLTATIIGTLPAGASITWYDAPFGGTILGTGNSFTTPVINANTSYYVGLCPATFTKIINVTTSPGFTASIAGNNQQVCQNNTTLAANSPTTGTGIWTVISGTGNFANPNLFNTTVSNLSLGNNVFEWTISAAGCPPSQSQVTITLVAAPTANAGVNQQLCANNTVLAATGSGTWSILSGTGNLTNITDPASAISNLSVGLNSLIWTVTLPGCPAAIDTVAITVSAAVSTANAGANQQICSSSASLDALLPIVGNGSWTLVAGSGSIANSTSINTSVSGLALGNNIFEWTVSAPGCPSTTDQVTITVDAIIPVPNAGTDQTLCINTAQLNANAAPVNTTGTWSVLAGSTNFSNVNDNNASLSNLSVGVNTLVWTIANANCPAVSDTVSITVSNALSVANAGADQQICSSYTNFSATLPIVGLGTWTLIAGTGNINDVNSSSSAITNMGVGVSVFEWTVSGVGCPSTSDTVSITVNLINTIANAGTNITICGNSTTLNANAPTTGLTGTWTSDQTALSFINANDQNTTVANLQNGNNTLIWTLTNNLGCPATVDTIIVNSVSNPSAAFAGSDNTICDNNTLLSAVAPLVGTGLWSITAGSGNLGNASSANCSLNGLIPGTVTCVWTVSNAPCPANSDIVLITILPALSPAIAGADASICDTQYSMNATAPTLGTGTWTLVSGNGTISNINSANATISNLGLGVNTFQWTVANNTCPDLTDQVSIIVDAPPSIASAGGDIQTCAQSTEITATAPLSGTGTWTVTSGNATISNPNSPSTGVVILSAGGATFNWQVTSGACPSTSDDLNVILLNGSDAANAGEDVTILIGDSTILNGSGGTINGWDPPAGLSCMDCPNPIAKPDTTTLYILSVTDINGCTSIDSVLITVDETTGWYLPNAFTPDNNGVNDVLYFYGTSVKEFILQVFDRWGEKVFETTNFNVGWDGSYKGKAAMAGIYTYQLTITFKSTVVEQVKGNVNLIRN